MRLEKIKSSQNTKLFFVHVYVQGGYMAAKVSKLDEQFKHDVREKQKQGKCTAIFSGVAIYVNGYTGSSDNSM